MKEAFFWRWLFFIVGIIILSLGISLTIKGQIVGVGSWDVLHIGLAQSIGLTIGIWSIIIGVAIIAFDSILNKRWPLVGTVLDMLLAGIFIDIFNFLIPTFNSVWMQFFAFVSGFFLLGIGCGMYIVANLGAGPRDMLMLFIVHRFNWSVTFARTTMEVSVALLGFLLGGPVGIGTVLMALCLGPIVQFAIKWNEKIFTRLSGVESTILKAK
ncbi:YitT family protein [Solibacillus sp. CAU 1738]|uniref:YczE/YyaS/YitT family protein n=1 Tax=Solibacillus sp. CAU 1738 TaxID=3140363 RepID=UPI0032615B6C